MTMTMTQTTLQEIVAEVASVAASHAEQVDTDGSYPVDAVAALRRSGLLGLVISKDAGGMGAGPAEFIEVVGAIAAACGSTAMIYLMHVAAAVTVASAPPAAMPDLLPRMASGEVLGTLAFPDRLLGEQPGQFLERGTHAQLVAQKHVAIHAGADRVLAFQLLEPLFQCAQMLL